MGNLSTGWCNLANIAFQAGAAYNAGQAAELAEDVPEWGNLHQEMLAHMAAHDVDPAAGQVRMSGMLDFDVDAGQFTGQGAERANAYLKRSYRAPYEVPEIA